MHGGPIWLTVDITNLTNRKDARTVDDFVFQPRADGSALQWKYLEGLSAQRMEIGQKAVESLLTRARDAFRDGFSSLSSTPGPMNGPRRIMETI